MFIYQQYWCQMWISLMETVEKCSEADKTFFFFLILFHFIYFIFFDFFVYQCCFFTCNNFNKTLSWFLIIKCVCVLKCVSLTVCWFCFYCGVKVKHQKHNVQFSVIGVASPVQFTVEVNTCTIASWVCLPLWKSTTSSLVFPVLIWSQFSVLSFVPISGEAVDSWYLYFCKCTYLHSTFENVWSVYIWLRHSNAYR